MLKLQNKAYDVLKYISLIALPSVVTFILGLGTLYSWDGAPIVAGTLALSDTLLGALLKKSTDAYNEEQDEGKENTP